MSDTLHLQLPYLAASQAQKHVTHNEALTLLDGLVQAAVKSRVLATPPVSPMDGDRYLVAPAPTGAWAGQAGKFALRMDGAWRFLAPVEGWSLWVDDENAAYSFDGASWVAAGTPTELQNLTLLGVNATADATNKLVVASATTLFNHAGNGHQIKLNKNAATDTASLLYQSGFSGRAEIGTTGDDNFHVKVSADGTTFHEALVIAANSGVVTAKKPLHLEPQAGDPAVPVDGQLWYNATSNSFRKRQNGSSSDLAAASVSWGAISGSLAAQTDLQAALNGKAALSHAHALSTLTDVGVTTPSAGQVLKYNGTLWTNQADATGGGGFADGDYGDIAVSGGATVFTINSNVVTYGKIQDVSASGRVLGRKTAGAGDIEELTGDDVRALLEGTAVLAADNAVSTTAMANVPGMAFAALANATYWVELLGTFQTAATTTGIALALDIPSGGVTGKVLVSISSTALVAVQQTTDDAVLAPSTGVAVANTDYPLFGRFIVRIGATGGTVQLRQRSEVAGSNTLLRATAGGGTAMIWKRIV
jgi:Protein of unknown function (DUF2793)